MIDLEWAKHFAADWIEAWNSHDLDKILAHYADDFEMTSPFIIERTSEASGMLKGKVAIRAYWQIGLAMTPPLKFDLIQLMVGVNSITLYYRRASGQFAAEVLIFIQDRLVVKGIAHYGE
jgi:ketosteroid isomerase-like protein